MSKTLKIAVTPGEPAGIGPDLIITLSQQAWDAQLVVYADADMLQQRAKLLVYHLTLFRIMLAVTIFRSLAN